MQAFSNPSQRFRQALAGCSSSSPSLEHLIRLADRLPSTSSGQADLRNPDPVTRETSLHIAAKRGRVDVCEWLLEEDHDEQEVSRDAAGDTVVHIAASLGHTDILHLYLARYPFVVEWVNSRSLTPLHLAAMKGEAEAAQILIDLGADINAPDLNGNSPLHMASSYGKLPVVKLLIDLGCQTDSRNNEGFSAADYAFSFTVLKELKSLIRQRADQLKEAKRAARAQRKARSSPDTVRNRRHGDSSTLSIALPPAPSRASSEGGYSPSPVDPATSPDSVPPTSNGFGLGLSYPAARSPGANSGTTSPAILATSGIPSLGSPIPPTPLPASPDLDYSPSLASSLEPAGSSAFPYRPTPIRPGVSRAPSDAPSTPRTPSSPYHNTTSPQPSPISPSTNSSIPPSPVSPGATLNGGSSTPARSPLSLRRIGRGPPGSSPLSTPTSTVPPSSQLNGTEDGDPFNPSPASALSAETSSTGVSSSGQTATPTPASPSPASPRDSTVRARANGASLVMGDMPYSVNPAVAAPPHLRDRSSSTTSSTSSSAYLAPPLSTLPASTTSSPPTSPPTSPPRLPSSTNFSSGHKLIRKSRSHAAHPSVSSSTTIPEGIEPPSSSFPSMGTRSVSGPAGTGAGAGTGRGNMESSRSTPPMPMPMLSPAWTESGGGGHRLSFSGEAGGEGEKGKGVSTSGSKLKKEKHSHGLGIGLGMRRASTVESGAGAEGSQGSSGQGKHGGRLSRVFGLGRKG